MQITDNYGSRCPRASGGAGEGDVSVAEEFRNFVGGPVKHLGTETGFSIPFLGFHSPDDVSVVIFHRKTMSNIQGRGRSAPKSPNLEALNSRNSGAAGPRRLKLWHARRNNDRCKP
jgi:hypothetical protein